MSQPDSFETLAIYHAEVARGIVHTAEWDARMAELQDRFDERVRARLEDYRAPDGTYIFPARLPAGVWAAIRRVLGRHRGPGDEAETREILGDLDTMLAVAEGLEDGSLAEDDDGNWHRRPGQESGS